MLQSMTGFGYANKEVDDLVISVEIRTLNSKYFDFNHRLPKQYSEYEQDLRQMASDVLKRGKVNIKLEIEAKSGAEEKMELNRSLYQAYHQELSIAATEMDPQADIHRIHELIFQIPEVLQNPSLSEEEKEAQWKKVAAVVQEALDECVKFRQQEGEGLAKGFLENLKNLDELLSDIEPFETERLDVLRKKFQDRLKDIQHGDFDENRLEQELIYYAEKYDISEEKDRLRSHLDYFKTTLEADKLEKGKKLSFISQEINREVNTIGSKANHSQMQRVVVDMKEELDKIKEQLANIL